MTTGSLTPGEPAPVVGGEPAGARQPSEGPAAAALLAAGVGSATLGLLTTLAEASTSVKDAMSFTDEVGPLSGKTSYAVAVWLIAWVVLHLALRRRGRVSPAVLTVTGVLIALGILGTFPVFFQVFAAE